MNEKIKLFTILVVILFFCTLTFNVFGQEKIKISLADTTAPTGLRGEGLKVFLEEVEKQTNGRVEMEVFWGESLLKTTEILKGVEEGVVDMGYINPNYYPKQMITHGAFSLHPQGPLKFTDIFRVYERCYDEIPQLAEELENRNQKVIYINAVLSLAVVAREPFTRFEDFKGRRIRAASRWWLAELEAAGAIPVSIPWGDCYMALQTGTIDGIFTNYDGEHRTKLDEPAPHVFTFKELWYGLPMLYTINLDTWNSLPTDIQVNLIQAGKAAEIRFGDLYEKEWNTIVAEQKEMGCVVNEASKEDIEKWVSMPIIQELQQAWVKEAEADGVSDAAILMDTMKKIIQEEL